MKTSKTYSIPFNDLRPLMKIHYKELHQAMGRVLRSGQYILGPEVTGLEQALALYLDMKYCIGVASGTDALTIALIARGCGPGKTVATVANSAPATVVAIRRTGANVVYTDVDTNGLMCGPIPKNVNYIVPVHLYGQTVKPPEGAEIIEDACQAIRRPRRGDVYKIGSRSKAVALSFYPTKNLGAYGDGGAILTNDPETASRCSRLRMYGMNGSCLIENGFNSRLDELQAAFLMVKLKSLDITNTYRRGLEEWYREELDHIPGIRTLDFSLSSNVHLFPIFVQSKPRYQVQDLLEEDGIQTAVHYRIPHHLQEPELVNGKKQVELPQTEALCTQVLSLPFWYGMTKEMVKRVCKSIGRAICAR